MDLWDVHAAARLQQGRVQPVEAPGRMEWTQRPGIGPGADILGSDLTGCRIVELGCGAGHNTAHLASVGATAIGVDRSSGQIERATAHYTHTGARFIRTSATAYLARGGERFDAIVSVFGAIGTSEPSAILAACSRRLVRRGLLAFSVAHPQRTGTIPTRPHASRTVLLPDGGRGAIQQWDIAPEAWSHALSRAGLQVVSRDSLYAPAGAPWPTTLLITARRP